MIAAGGRQYFNSAYITIRVIRSRLKCMLPIEVFFAGPNELPTSAINHMQRTFPNLRFVDVYDTAEMRNTRSKPMLKGYQLKVFAILLSSFEEVLYLDADNIPLADPSVVFSFDLYRQHGALFWPDRCNFFSCRPEAWAMFGIEEPALLPLFPARATTVWTHECNTMQSVELETGQIVLNKRAAWRALLLTTFINWHHEFFHHQLLWSDKNTYIFGFHGTGTLFDTVAFPHVSYGLALHSTHGDHRVDTICSNSRGQRHPETGAVIFVHRSAAKYAWPSSYLSFMPHPRAWTHVVDQPAKTAWQSRERGGCAPDFFLPDATSQLGCWEATSNTTTWAPVDDSVCASAIVAMISKADS